jgi:hypothetical protein
MSHGKTRKLLLWPWLCLTLAATLAACGGGSKATSGPSPATLAAIRNSITVGFTSNDPAICVRNATPNLIDNLYGSLAKCRSQQGRGRPAKSVSISDISASGGTAHARAAPHGGTNDGEEFRLTLAKVGPDWKLDDLRYVYGSDPNTDKQVDLIVRDIGESQDLFALFGVRATRCVEARLRTAFRTGGVPFGKPELRTEAKTVLIGCMRSDPSLAAVYRGHLLRRLDNVARKEVGGTGARCIVGRLRHAITNQDVVEVLASQGRSTRLIRKLHAIGRRCGSIEAILHAFDDFAKT